MNKQDLKVIVHHDIQPNKDRSISSKMSVNMIFSCLHYNLNIQTKFVHSALEDKAGIDRNVLALKAASLNIWTGLII